MILLLALAGAVAGAIVGSFIATLCLRLPTGRGAMLGRSSCDGCDRALGPAELVPLVSAALSRGRCRTCGAPIDPLHWRVEAAAAAIGGGAIALSPTASGAALAVLGWLLLAPAILDARHHWLPDRLTLALALAGLALGGLLDAVPLVDRLIGGVAGFAALALLATGYRLVRNRQGLGGGDPKLLGAIGLWTGWAALPAILLIGSLAGLAAALVTRRGPLERIAFGPLLALGAGTWSAVAVAGAVEALH